MSASKTGLRKLVTAASLIKKKRKEKEKPANKSRCLEMLKHLMGLISVQYLKNLSSGLPFR